MHEHAERACIIKCAIDIATIPAYVAVYYHNQVYTKFIHACMHACMRMYVYAYICTFADMGRISGSDKEEVSATATTDSDCPSSKRRKLEG